MKEIISDLNAKYKSGATHTFLLYLNTNDGFLSAGDLPRLLPLADYLMANSFISEASFVMSFNVTTGLRLISGDKKIFFETIAELLHKPELTKTLETMCGYGDDIEKRIVMAERFLSYAMKTRLHNGQIKKGTRKPFIVLVFERLETVAPPGSAASSEDKNRLALELILSLAKNPDIRQSGNAVILVAESLSSVAEQLNSETNSIIPIKILFPGIKERELLFESLALVEDKEKVSEFARNSAGMSSNMLSGFIAQGLYSDSLSVDALFQTKKKFIEEQSGNLLEVHRPFCGVEVIGGLEEHKNFIMEDVVANMKKGKLLAIPSGILLLGAQGTGKTVFAEAIAYEAGLPFLSLKNVREMWVGQSERNLEFALELILAQAPVIVFIDEIDQEMQMRSSGGDNTGVNQRIQGRLFRFMSDTDLRGRVLWIAATNRPDLIDSALLREGRFDKKIPFFPPMAMERVSIVKALLHKNQLAAKRIGSTFEVDISDEEIAKFARMAHCHAERRGEGDKVDIVQCNWEEFHSLNDKEQDDEVYFTGGKLESLITDAIAMAVKSDSPLRAKHLFAAMNDSLPSSEMASHEMMTELAMRFSNSLRFIPKEGRWVKMARRLRIVGLSASGNGSKSKTSINFKDKK